MRKYEESVKTNLIIDEGNKKKRFSGNFLFDDSALIIKFFATIFDGIFRVSNIIQKHFFLNMQLQLQ